MKSTVWVIGIMSILFGSLAYALDQAQLKELRTAVLEMCRGGSIEGESSRINVVGSATGKIVVVKGLLEGGADAKVELSKEEWDGIKALANPTDYNACVTQTLAILVPALSGS